MALEVSPDEVARTWNNWLLERNRRGASIVLLLAIFLFPLFIPLDLLVAPSRWQFWLLFISRATVTACTIAMFAIVRSRLFQKYSTEMTAAHITICGLGIDVMVAVLGGFRSPYYAGLNLVMIGAGLLYVWPRNVVLTAHGILIAAYIIPNLLVGSGNEWVTGISNLFFLVSTALIVSAGQVFTYRNEYRQVIGQLTLERTKANLEKAHEQLKQLDRFKSQFFANITHELKTPLAMILSPLELMLQGEIGQFSEAETATLRSMFRNGIKLLKLIGDLLELSKLEESQVRLRIAEQDMVEYLRGLVAQVQPLAERKGIEMRFVTSAERTEVWCDLDRLERVFLNLLSNATKFTPEGGTIEVLLEDQGDTVRVDVRDDGPGFPADKAERVFERFYQVDMGGTRRYGGTGIGLALAKEIIDLHGGRIWATSDEGKGAVFSVVLHKDKEHFRPEVLDRRASRKKDMPGGQRGADRGLMDWAAQLSTHREFRLLDIAEATERRVVERDPNENRHLHSVLVVEDMPDIIRVIHLTLRQHFKVMAAPDGLKGFELATRELPSLIITDLMMPEIDGLELTKRLRADPRTRHIPIIMLTARGDLEDRLAGIETGVNAYLTKPFSPRELLSTVRSILNVQEAAAEVLLNQRMDSLETIAGGLAHEIRNPLNYIKNALVRVRMDVDEFTKLTRGGAVPESAKRIEQLDTRMAKMFATAESGIQRIARTVDLMGKYSREGFSRELRPHDVFTAVMDVVNIVLPATGRNVKVETSFDGDGTIECVPEEFHQVITNLVQNAIEAVPDDGTGRVRVRGWNEDGKVILSVGDNGAGIRPEDQVKIFTPFFTTKAPGRGMGLGLTIVWRVVHSLGGAISLQSEVGAGSEFVVRIPHRAARPQSAPRPAVAARA